jgi:hypothetical protein
MQMDVNLIDQIPKSEDSAIKSSKTRFSQCQKQKVVTIAKEPFFET